MTQTQGAALRVSAGAPCGASPVHVSALAARCARRVRAWHVRRPGAAAGASTLASPRLALRAQRGRDAVSTRLVRVQSAFAAPLLDKDTAELERMRAADLAGTAQPRRSAPAAAEPVAAEF